MVRIELIGTEEERAKTFYWLMTTGETTSPEKDVIFISYPHFEELKKQKGLKWRSATELTDKKIIEKNVEISNTQGWGFPFNSKKAHYFIDGISLCGNWMFLGKIFDDKHNHPDNCKQCIKRKDRL